MELKLVPITADNWRTATFLTTDPEHKIPLDEQWIANNAFRCCSAFMIKTGIAAF